MSEQRIHTQLKTVEPFYLTPGSKSFYLLSYMCWKRVFDLIFVLLIAPVWGPVMVILAILIKLDSPQDPVFFVQERTGKGGRRFKMFKFRTMVVNAQEMRSQLLHLNERKWPDFRIENDPRITRIGKTLRRLHLDEMPQILNVLLGDMALVGPRPTSWSSDLYEVHHQTRLMVAPGITGTWQIIQHSESDFDERAKMDCEYVNTMSLTNDIYLIAKTAFFLVLGRFKC